MPSETKTPDVYPDGNHAEAQEATEKALIAELRALGKAYALFSPLTNLSYVECEEENYNDQIQLYAAKEEAEKAAEELEEKGIRVTVREFQTVEVSVPADAEHPAKEKKMYLNQVRQYLGTLPFIGVNAILYKPKEREAASVCLSSVLPEDFEKKVMGNGLYQPNLQLTGLYLMQEARRKKEYVDKKQLQEMDEEFSSNLVRSGLFLAVLPPKGHEKDDKIDLRQCQLPYLTHQNGDRFLPVFTDIWEYQKYTQGKEQVRPIQVPFAKLMGFWVKDAKAYMMNPMGYSLPITREMIPRILERFAVEEK